jgi:hypothetical protein
MAPVDLTVLIDGSYALHRVMKVGGESNPFSHMKSSDGVPTGGCFAYLLGLSRSLSLFNVRSVVNVWDSGIYSARRLKLYEGYKCSRANTKTTVEGMEYFGNFDAQKKMVDEFLLALGIPSVLIKCKEADDVIGFLCKIIAGPVMILSDDKDYWHLITDQVCVYRPVKEQYLDMLTFREVSKGFAQPWRYLLYCAIIGDAGDDIPGVPGIGGTTASKVACAVASPNRTEVARVCQSLIASDSRSAQRFRTIAQNFDVIGRNYRLLDIRLEEFNDADEGSLRRQMDSYHPPNDINLMRLLKQYDMQSIAGKMTSWIAPFRRLAKPVMGVSK